MCLDQKKFKINLNSYEKSFFDLDVNDVYTYEIHYKSTYAIVNKVEIKEYRIEEILIKFQMAILLRIDGIQSKDYAYREFSKDLNTFNGVLIKIDKVHNILQKYIGVKFLRRLGLNVGVKKKYIYLTQEESIYFKTYILISNKHIYQIDMTLYEEDDNYFNSFPPVFSGNAYES